jgi:hypothetical protein
MGLYVPSVNEPGLDLGLLIDGITYPGVQVSAPAFDQNTGFDIGNFDINPFDNIAYNPDGTPTYDPRILDAIYNSRFLDIYLGTRPTDINVVGGEFVGPYESHAPEELVPGSEFDTMDFRVYTREVTYYTGDGSTTGPYAAPTYSDAVEVTINNVVIRPTQYTVDYGDSALAGVTFNTAPAADDIIVILETYPVSGLELRIFQDMRGTQATYRITPATTTTLVQPLFKNQDIIYVDDAGALPQPNLNNNQWGVITINAERIMYRVRDLATNTVSSLLRGTAGTAVADHAVDSVVYDTGRNNLAPDAYQDHVIYTNTLGDGSSTTFSAANIDLSTLDVDFAEQAILVYVAGIRVYTGYTVDSVAPATITFTTAPTAGYEVSIRVRQSLGWYQPSGGYPSNGEPLQITQTYAARFFRGQI